MSVLQDGILTLVQNGLIELLVFLLIFVVTFGILRKIHLFAKNSSSEELAKVRKVHLLISLAMGATILFPRYAPGYSQYDVIAIIERSLPQVSLLVIALVGLIVLLGIFNLKLGGSSGNPLRGVLSLVLVGAVIWIFGGSAGWYWNLPYWMTQELAAVAIALIIFGLVVGFIMGPDKSNRKYKNLKEFIDAGDNRDWKKAKLNQNLYDLLTERKPK